MNKYIDAEKLIAEIEKRQEERQDRRDSASWENEYWPESDFCARDDEDESIIDIVNSLQQEQQDNWDEQYREDNLRTRFAFYTYKDEDSVLYLSNVFVEETSRNKGFGTKILQAAEKVAETIGAIRICLKVKQDSPANAWYRKRGYGYFTFEGEYDWLEKKLEYLKPKQEQSDADLAEEITRFFSKNPIPHEHITDWPLLKNTAIHFYELGLNARKK